MHKQLRVRFFAIVASVSFLILGIFYIALNTILIQTTDDNIHRVLTYLNSRDNFIDENEDNYLGEEKKFRIRFFTVEIKPNGETIYLGKDVYQIDEESAKEYAFKNLAENATYGKEKKYNYVRKNFEDGTVRFIFLDCEEEYNNLSLVASVSGVIVLALWIVISISSALLSKYAIKPYVEQYKSERRFITDASHELKTPLAIIQANLEILALEYEKNEWLTSSLNQTNRMTKLVNDLVLMTKLSENNSYALKIERFNLSELLIDAAESYQILADRKLISYSYHIEEDIFYNGDIDSVSKLFFILLDNAIKYTNQGGIMKIDLFSNKKGINIIFYNTCLDINSNNVSKLFSRFYRVEESRSRKTGGFGIGLALAKTIVDAHNGSIKAEAQGNNAVEFKIKL